jgi:fibro-slime domain-containing protein
MDPIQLARGKRSVNNPSVLPRLTVGSVSVALLALLGAACGARTGLLVPEICATAGAERPCQDACGLGSQTCSDGLWKQCQVPVATRGCADDCGSGSQECSAGAWGKCQVPVAMRSCSDGCGDGQESCLDGRWQDCEVSLVQRACSSVCGPGHETCRKGAWGKCDAPLPKPPQLKASVRDFSPKTHPDFEASYPPGLDTGIVARTLGDDDKPVYAGMPRTQSTSGAANFDMWYRDTPMINLSEPLDLQLLPAPGEDGFFSFDDQTFFPIDGQLLGNEGRAHNFHFTLEASTTFEYRGGEVFSFEGDDDMWVFINRQLAIDLGGLHSSLPASVALDDFAPTAGMLPGAIYPLHFFFAERHTIESHFTLRTSIAEPGSCD